MRSPSPLMQADGPALVWPARPDSAAGATTIAFDSNKRLEDGLEQIGRHARPVIAHANRRHVPDSVAGRSRPRSAPGDVADGITRDVFRLAVSNSGWPLTDAGFGVRSQQRAALRLSLPFRNRRLNHRAARRVAGPRGFEPTGRLGAGQLEQLVDENGQASDVAFDAPEILASSSLVLARSTATSSQVSGNAARAGRLAKVAARPTEEFQCVRPFRRTSATVPDLVLTGRVDSRVARSPPPNWSTRYTLSTQWGGQVGCQNPAHQGDEHHDRPCLQGKMFGRSNQGCTTEMNR